MFSEAYSPAAEPRRGHRGRGARRRRPDRLASEQRPTPSLTRCRSPRAVGLISMTVCSPASRRVEVAAGGVRGPCPAGAPACRPSASSRASVEHPPGRSLPTQGGRRRPDPPCGTAVAGVGVTGAASAELRRRPRDRRPPGGPAPARSVSILETGASSTCSPRDAGLGRRDSGRVRRSGGATAGEFVAPVGHPAGRVRRQRPAWWRSAVEPAGSVAVAAVEGRRVPSAFSWVCEQRAHRNTP